MYRCGRREIAARDLDSTCLPEQQCATHSPRNSSTACHSTARHAAATTAYTKHTVQGKPTPPYLPLRCQPYTGYTDWHITSTIHHSKCLPTAHAVQECGTRSSRKTESGSLKPARRCSRPAAPQQLVREPLQQQHFLHAAIKKTVLAHPIPDCGRTACA
jgi:hypothetical protein